MSMDERKIKILEAIINDYITTAEPVGSRTIAKKYDLGISSATIRNEMADLEEMGYIEQLHTSSGRKPSDKGYRLYVDKLMRKTDLTLEEENVIKSQLLNAALYEADKMIKNAAELLSNLTNLTCIAKTPSKSTGYIKSIQLIAVQNSIVVVLVTESGIINNKIIKIDKPVNEVSVLKLNNLLNDNLKGLQLEDINLTVINKIRNEMQGYDDIFNAIIPALCDSLNNDDEVFLEGASNIFNYPEFKDIEKAREFMILLDDENNLKTLLKNGSDISICIGQENLKEEAKDCSIVSANYGINGKSLGKIALIGPTRMPYSKVVTVLSKIVEEIDREFMKYYYDE